ncbi:hypothetical protein [Brenneria tiliae]|uniref:Uncharacterized protein n=1 Tax=Brenneria tiliae TaxID=2914984 RepID=A0ABT0MTN2_9GAMM|nr:hypothetical protein [Brenneria tiliae]MCL2893142.1 hypothetical protein [Brenneria tiliae]
MGVNEPSITIYAAPKGSTVLDDNGDIVGTSNWGHVFISVKDFNYATGQYESRSIGFSPGEDFLTNTDKLLMLAPAF